jgi:predicted DCC family thiol-disulfide oxidoreductase YuxK
VGWTGAQYSLYRAALAGVGAWTLCTALGPFASARPGPTLLVLFAKMLVALAAFALAAGFRDRIAALMLVAFVAGTELFAGRVLTLPSWTSLFTERAGGLLAALLWLHVATPRAPFGAFEARGRIDPRGGWQRPAWMTELGWALLLVFAAAPMIVGDEPRDDVVGLFRSIPEIAAAALGLALRSLRPAAWSALLLWHLAHLFAFGAVPGESSRLLLILFAADPGAWRGRSLVRSDARVHRDAALARSAETIPARLFYDGDCGFCHRSVRFVLAEELATPEPLRLRFAALGGPSFQDCLARHPELDPASLPDSIVLELEDGTIRTRSAAALEIAARLGGFWRFLALVGSRLPSGLLDAGYDAIARVRKRLFAQPKDACPILPPALRARFDA